MSGDEVKTAWRGKMTVTRVSAILSIAVTGPYYSIVPYGLFIASQGGTSTMHGRDRFLAGYVVSAILASVWLALVFFRWRWKQDAGFGWLVVLTAVAFGVNLALAAISDFLVISFVPGLSVVGEDGSHGVLAPEGIPILGQLTAAVLYLLTFPFLVMFLAVAFCIERVLARSGGGKTD